jgi:hypothetical protein
MNRARPALTETAAEAWAVQPEIVAKNIEQRHIRIVHGDRHCDGGSETLRSAAAVLDEVPQCNTSCRCFRNFLGSDRWHRRNLDRHSFSHS